MANFLWVAGGTADMKQSRYRRPEPARLEKRQAPRHQVAVSRAKAGRKKQVPILAILNDISAFGCCLTLDAVLREDESISLSFDDSEAIEANIIWQKANRIGCRFAKRISPQLFRAMTLEV